MPAESGSRSRSPPGKAAAVRRHTEERPVDAAVDDEELMSDAEVATYEAEGVVFPQRRLFSEAELQDLETLLAGLVSDRPEGLAPEDLLNLHTTHPGILRLCRHPKVVAMAQALLKTRDVSIFTSRILCKPPGTGKDIPWHQDSNYWPLVAPGHSEVHPTVASVWLTFDDVDAGNGPMQILPFSAQPETRYRNCTEFVNDSGGSTKGFDNFNLSLDASKLNVTGAKWCYLKRGECEWHSAWTVHRSDANKSERRRLAWIVRYCPTGTSVRSGVRGAFDENFPIVPASGTGSDACPVRAGEDLYAPCFGNSLIVQALKR